MDSFNPTHCLVMSTLEAAFGNLPEPILNKLDSMIRRVRGLLFLRGLFATLAVALACLITIMIIDASMTLFSSPARWTLSLVGLVITAAAAWKFLARPLSRKFTLTHMARILEIRHPELQERISTAVELLSSDDPDSIKGSEELIAAVVDSAVVDVEAVDPKTEFNPAKTRRFRNISIAFGAVLLLSLVIWPKQSFTLLARAMAPFLDIGNAYADSLVVDPGDIRVAQGSSVTIEVSVKHKRLRRAEIRRLLPDGTEAIERMTLVGEDTDGIKRFSTTFPSVEEGFDYRVRAGSALTRYYDVDAVAPPTVDELAIAYDYPDYTGLVSTEKVSDTGEIRAVAHTRVSVSTKINKPVQTSKLLINETKDLGAPTVEGNTLNWEFELRPGMKGNWSLALSDLDGFQSPPETYPLDVLPDKAPTVQLTQPILREMKMRPTERLQIHADVIEDFGIRDIALLVTPQGTTQPMEILQPGASAGNVAGQFKAVALLDLASLELSPQQKRIAVQMRVRDNRPTDYSGPGIGLSEMLYIEIDRSAKSLADQAIEAQKKEVREALRKAKEELERSRDKLKQTEDALRRDDEVSDVARERLEDFSEHSEKARDQLDEVVAALDESLFKEQAEKANQISEETIAEAREKADLVPVLDNKDERVETAKDAREKIEEAIKQVDEIRKEMEKADEDYETISELNDLSNKQQELAMNAEEWAEKAEGMADAAAQDPQKQMQQDREEQQKLQEFQQKQEQLQQELGEMLKDNAAALSEVLEEQQEEAQAMSEKASELAEQQNELREMSKEALDADSNQEEVLREELLAYLEKEQSQLAEEAAERAAEAQAEAETPSALDPIAPEGSDPANPQEIAENTEATASESSPSETPSTQDDPADASPPTAAQELANQLSEAAQQASDAAESLGEENLEVASESANEASESLAEAAAQSESSTEDSAASEGRAEELASAEGSEATESPTAGEPAAPEMAELGNPESGAPEASAPEPGSAEPAEPGSPTPSELAERQEALAEQIEAVKNGDLQEALAQIEAQIGEEASEMQAAAAALEESLDNLSQNSAESGANRAEQSLSRGAQKASDASNQLADAQTQQAQAEEKNQVEAGELASGAEQSMSRGLVEQERTANYLEQAAEALQATSEAIGQTQEGLEPSEGDDRIADSSDLAEGFQEMSESAQSQSAQEAAQQSAQAAEAMQQLAQAAMQKLGMPGSPSSEQAPPGQQSPPMPQQMTGDPNSESLNESGMKAADANGAGIPPELQQLGISVEDWAKFRGALVGGSATAIETDLPAEYRELVGRYFQVIAKEAGKKK